MQPWLLNEDIAEECPKKYAQSRSPVRETLINRLVARVAGETM